MKFLLASSSPRRQELLKKAGYRFEIVVPDISEELHEGESPADLVTRLAYEKAAAVAALHPDAVVLGADTVVFFDDEILGKPSDKDEAESMLIRLSGKEHTVFTGFALVGKRTVTGVDSSQVKFRDVSPEERAWYISTGEPLDKAGAYGIQENGALFIERIVGSYTTIVGLNLATVSVALGSFGVNPYDQTVTA